MSTKEDMSFMSAIVDRLILGPKDIDVIKRRYPACITTNLSRSRSSFQEYRVIIPNEEEDSYYNYLLDCHLATSSHKLISRLASDKTFAESVQSKIANKDEEPD